jgi:hypothetical protein
VPHFALDNVRVTAAGTKVRIRGVVRQTHAASHMVTAIPVYAVNGQGHARFLAFVFVDDPSTSFTLTAPAGTKSLLLDPENSTLRR